MTLVPVASSQEVGGLFVLVSFSSGTDGFGLVDPLCRDAELLNQELLLHQRLRSLPQNAVSDQELSHSQLPNTKEREEPRSVLEEEFSFIISRQFSY